jgi:hypothetical protein
MWSQFKWTTGLTGTPASNGYKDLHGQYLAIDGGHRLGKYKTAFMAKYYITNEHKHTVIPGTEDEIKEKISDITIEMSAEDYNPLPKLIINDVFIDMPPDLRKMYDKLEEDFFLKLDSGAEIEVFNKAALINKLLQFSNGAVYLQPGQPQYNIVHDLKLDALEDIIDSAGGKQVLCSYSYKSDAWRIMKKFKSLHPVNLTECKSTKALNDAMGRWKTGDCPLMIGHAACLHGDTEVLTEHGWVKIINVVLTDRVYDGVEFVNHDGCFYSGYKKVIDVFGITMTPNHKLLLNGEWVEGRNVQDSEKHRDEALRFREEIENSMP